MTADRKPDARDELAMARARYLCPSGQRRHDKLAKAGDSCWWCESTAETLACDMREDERAGYERGQREERGRAEALRAVSDALCGEFERAVAHADFVAGGSKGMSVPFMGDFASAARLPSIVSRMRWWSLELRKALLDTPDTRPPGDGGRDG